MSILQIQTGVDNPILRKKSSKVLQITKDLKKLVKDMQDTLHLDGIGLAAPQVGVNSRIILVTLNSGQKNANTVIMVNPEILFFSEEKTFAEEGCLSLPKIFEKVERAKSIIVKYQDLNMREHLLNLSNINARITQHELDHLNGVLFLDRVFVSKTYFKEKSI